MPPAPSYSRADFRQYRIKWTFYLVAHAMDKHTERSEMLNALPYGINSYIALGVDNTVRDRSSNLLNGEVIRLRSTYSKPRQRGTNAAGSGSARSTLILLHT